jgi:outer membrane protein OmpA-like peptidoglycan-associated protein
MFRELLELSWCTCGMAASVALVSLLRYWPDRYVAGISELSSSCNIAGIFSTGNLLAPFRAIPVRFVQAMRAMQSHPAMKSIDGGVMRNVVPNPRFWIVLAVFVLTFTALLPAADMLQQDSMNASSMGQDIMQNVKEVYFPFNIYSRVVDPDVLQADANYLKQHPDAHLWLQGYADIRGDIFYNLVLSYRRAQFVKGKLVANGVSESQIGFATGWGKLYPVCQTNDDSCYQQQRRVDIVPPDHM